MGDRVRDQLLFIDPFIPSTATSSSARRNTSRLEMDRGKFYMLCKLMGDNFIRNMNVDEQNELYDNLTRHQWLTISIYFTLACAIDQVSDTRNNLLELLDAEMSVDNTVYLS